MIFSNGIQKSLALLAIVAAVSIAPFASAHGVGESLERVVGGYLIDVGYNSFEPKAGELIRFDFSLSDAATGTPEPFDEVSIRIREGERIVFAFIVPKAETGLTTSSITFPKAGNLSIALEYTRAGSAIASTTFDFEVRDSSSEARAVKILLLGALILILGIGVGFALGRIFKKRAGMPPHNS